MSSPFTHAQHRTLLNFIRQISLSSPTEAIVVEPTTDIQIFMQLEELYFLERLVHNWQARAQKPMAQEEEQSLARALHLLGLYQTLAAPRSAVVIWDEIHHHPSFRGGIAGLSIVLLALVSAVLLWLRNTYHDELQLELLPQPSQPTLQDCSGSYNDCNNECQEEWGDPDSNWERRQLQSCLNDCNYMQDQCNQQNQPAIDAYNQEKEAVDAHNQLVQQKMDRLKPLQGFGITAAVLSGIIYAGLVGFVALPTCFSSWISAMSSLISFLSFGISNAATLGYNAYQIASIPYLDRCFARLLRAQQQEISAQTTIIASDHELPTSRLLAVAILTLVSAQDLGHTQGYQRRSAEEQQALLDMLHQVWTALLTEHETLLTQSDDTMITINRRITESSALLQSDIAQKTSHVHAILDNISFFWERYAPGGASTSSVDLGFSLN